MNAHDRALELLMRGKQIGKSFSFDRDGKTFYASIAIQKQGDIYKFLVDEIDEKLMAAEVFEREELRSFDALDDAISFIETTTSVKIGDLAPRKGQRWFL